MKIGITFGVFDLLHAGHIMMLEEARRNCDYLIVGLNTDPSEVSPEKSVPTQTVVERYIQLEGCRYVDEIIPYETEQDLIDIIKALPIQVRIIGEEYRDMDFTGKNIVWKKGLKFTIISGLTVFQVQVYAKKSQQRKRRELVIE
ncbi:adenylyltransferase/cytidyltransferase family protein [Sphingobacterium sp. KU25419]|nr:adenylyltransferase/cytidyltransferase family protein [Sphingobacterium sp. KU25419]